jgi:quercetin dioxygenase-like cupin family protein
MGGSLEKGTFFAIRWQDLPWEEVRKGISRKVALKDRLMLIMYRFGPFLVWPEETHEAEQGGYVIKGKLELNLPSRGEKILISAGEGYLIESNLPHFWKTLEEETILIDIFSPPRMELLPKNR